MDFSNDRPQVTSVDPSLNSAAPLAVAAEAPPTPELLASMPGGDPNGPLVTGAVASQLGIQKGGQRARGAFRGALKEQNHAAGLAVSAAGKQHEVDQANAESANAIYSKQLEDVNNWDTKLRADYATAETQKTQAFDTYLRTVNDLKDTHIYNWYSDASTGGKILGILSQALAGGFQGLSGQSGPTPLDRIIDQDLNVQRLKLQQKNDVASQAGNLYKTLDESLKNRVLTENAMRDIAYNSVEKRVKAMAAAQGVNQADANYQKFLADIDQKRADNRKALDVELGKSFQTQATEASKANVDYNQMWVSRENSMDALRGKLSEKGKQVGLFGVKGSEGLSKALGEKHFQDLKNKWDAVPVFRQASLEVRDLLTGERGKHMDVGDKAATLNQIYDHLKTILGKEEGLGALAKADLDLVGKQLGTRGGIEAILENAASTWVLPSVRSGALRTSNQIAAALERLSGIVEREARQAVKSTSYVDPETGKQTHLEIDENTAWK